MGSNVKMLDGTIRQQRPMFKVQVRAVADAPSTIRCTKAQRFSEFEWAIAAASQKVLIQQLRQKWKQRLLLEYDLPAGSAQGGLLPNEVGQALCPALDMPAPVRRFS